MYTILNSIAEMLLAVPLLIIALASAFPWRVALVFYGKVIGISLKGMKE